MNDRLESLMREYGYKFSHLIESERTIRAFSIEKDGQGNSALIFVVNKKTKTALVYERGELIEEIVFGGN